MYKDLAEEFFERMMKRNQNKHTRFREFTRNYTIGEIKILGYLSYVKDGITAGEIMDILHITSARVASLLNGLEKKKYIIREQDPNDKRKVIVKVTNLAKEMLAEKKEEFVNKISKVIEEVGVEDAKEYGRLMDKFDNAVERICEDGKFIEKI